MLANAFALFSITRIAESTFSGKVSLKVLITLWKLILESDKFFLYIPTVQATDLTDIVLNQYKLCGKKCDSRGNFVAC